MAEPGNGGFGALEEADGWADLPPRSHVPRWLAALGRFLGAGITDPLGGLDRAHTEFMLWAPVALGCGIGAYFALPAEPGALALRAGWGLALAALLLWLRGPRGLRFLGAMTVLAVVGLQLAALRSETVAAPVLAHRYYGPVTGRVVEIDRSGRDVLRITLDHVVLRDMAAAARPARVRVALYGTDPAALPEPGQTVMMTAHLAPPAGPAEPGGWDFRRNAWFERLGGLGYTRTPVLEVAPAAPGDWALAVHRLRMHLSAAMQAQIGGQAGAVASALITGDRSGISEATNGAMRAANLYHIVSISGLHMGMLAGFVFAAVRHGLAMIGSLALVLPTKKIAAAIALVASSLYLWVSGAEIATQRAWVMVAVMLVAVLLDRRAISLRTVAIAAFVLLVLWPEALVGPGFQMSFAATVALILVAGPWGRVQGRLPVWTRPLAMLLVTSLVASFVTGPIAAAQFGRMAHYGILANLLAVPVMGMVVMPAGVLAALLAPFGLAGPALWVMGIGTEWMLRVAARVAALDGAQTAIVAPPGWVLPLLALSALLMVLGRGAGRGLALAGLVAGALGWTTASRPALLIAPEGTLVGLMTPAGRALSKNANAFVAETWLEGDGDTAMVEEAAARPGFDGPRGTRAARWQGRALVHLSGKGAVERLEESCQDGALVVLAAEAPRGFSGDCALWDLRRLRASGAVAYDGAGQFVTAAASSRHRLWGQTERAPEGAPDPVTALGQ